MQTFSKGVVFVTYLQNEYTETAIQRPSRMQFPHRHLDTCGLEVALMGGRHQNPGLSGRGRRACGPAPKNQFAVLRSERGRVGGGRTESDREDILQAIGDCSIGLAPWPCVRTCWKETLGLAEDLVRL